MTKINWKFIRKSIWIICLVAGNSFDTFAMNFDILSLDGITPDGQICLNAIGHGSPNYLTKKTTEDLLEGGFLDELAGRPGFMFNAQNPIHQKSLTHFIQKMTAIGDYQMAVWTFNRLKLKELSDMYMELIINTILHESPLTKTPFKNPNILRDLVNNSYSGEIGPLIEKLDISNANRPGAYRGFLVFKYQNGLKVLFRPQSEFPVTGTLGPKYPLLSDVVASIIDAELKSDLTPYTNYSSKAKGTFQVFVNTALDFIEIFNPQAIKVNDEHISKREKMLAFAKPLMFFDLLMMRWDDHGANHKMGRGFKFFGIDFELGPTIRKRELENRFYRFQNQTSINDPGDLIKMELEKLAKDTPRLIRLRNKIKPYLGEFQALELIHRIKSFNAILKGSEEYPQSLYFFSTELVNILRQIYESIYRRRISLAKNDLKWADKYLGYIEEDLALAKALLNKELAAYEEQLGFKIDQDNLFSWPKLSEYPKNIETW